MNNQCKVDWTFTFYNEKMGINIKHSGKNTFFFAHTQKETKKTQISKFSNS